MDEKLYLIVLNWNGSEDTIECLKSIQNSSYANYTTVLVDNGSKYEELQRLNNWCHNSFDYIISYTKEEALNGGDFNSERKMASFISPKKLVFIENNENLGFAGGNNVGLKYILSIKATYAMLLNNDTLIEKNSLTILMHFLCSHDDYIAVTPQIRYLNPNDTIWNCGGKITWFGNRRYYYAGSHISKVPDKGFKRVTFITGCALLFKPGATGILTEKFFFGEEDLDFSFRQKKAKKKMACCFSSVIYHKVNASVKNLDVNILGSVYLQYLSRFINNRQYSSAFMLWIKVSVNLSYAVPMIMIRYKIGMKRILKMVTMIIRELNRIDEINRDYCIKYLKEDFSKKEWE